MYGRYGFDSLGKCMLVTAIILTLLSTLMGSETLNLIAWALIIYTYFRIFSRNTYKRAAENQAYLSKTYKLRNWFAKQKNMLHSQRTCFCFECYIT